MKIAVLTALWGRHDIVRLFALGMDELKKEFDITVYAVVSNEDDAYLGYTLGFELVWAENNPLGEKWNVVYRKAKEDKPDAYLIMGSDDLISPSGLRMLIDSGEAHVGFNSIIFYDSVTGDCGKFTYNNTRLIGAGRFIRRYAAEACDELCKVQFVNTDDNEFITTKSSTRATMNRKSAEYLKGIKQVRIQEYFPVRLWQHNINHGLDNTLEQRLSYFGYPPVQLSADVLIDVKSATNMWQMDDWTEKIAPFDIKGLTSFSSEVIAAIIAQTRVNQDNQVDSENQTENPGHNAEDDKVEGE